MVRRLFQAAAGADASRPVRCDVKARAFELALNTVARVVAGKRYYGDGAAEASEEAERFRAMVREYFAMHGASNLQDFVPVLALVDIGGANKRAIRLSKARNEWAQRLIDEHRAASVSRREQGKTMVGDLLEMQASDTEAYSDKVIRALCLSILQTGTDTSSATIEWGMAGAATESSRRHGQGPSRDRRGRRHSAHRGGSRPAKPSLPQVHRHGDPAPPPGRTAPSTARVGLRLLRRRLRHPGGHHAPRQCARHAQGPARVGGAGKVLAREVRGREERRQMDASIRDGTAAVPRGRPRREHGRPRAGHACAVLRVEEDRR